MQPLSPAEQHRRQNQCYALFLALATAAALTAIGKLRICFQESAFDSTFRGLWEIVVALSAARFFVVNPCEDREVQNSAACALTGPNSLFQLPRSFCKRLQRLPRS